MNPKQIGILLGEDGVANWNHWISRRKAKLDLAYADLSDATLAGVKLRRADLRYADLSRTDLSWADLRGADLRHACLSGADLWETDLRQADLRGAVLQGAVLVRTKMEASDLTGCRIYGISAWDVTLDGAAQSNLIITPKEQPTIETDNLEIAQFLYLILSNQKLREVIETITSKIVLILGRFTNERKVVLDAIRDKLRKRNYLPVLFDFEKPRSRDLTETVRLLAHMAHFVIADITDAKSIPQELMAIVPDLPSVPIQPLLLASQREYSMFEHLSRFPQVLQPVIYDDQEMLLAELETKIIAPAETRVRTQVPIAYGAPGRSRSKARVRMPRPRFSRSSRH